MLTITATTARYIKKAFCRRHRPRSAGLTEVRTCDTLCDPAEQVVWKRCRVPDPLFENRNDPSRKRIRRNPPHVPPPNWWPEDPRFRVHQPTRNRARHSQRQCELHLDINGRHPQTHLPCLRQYRRAAGGLSRSIIPSSSTSNRRLYPTKQPGGARDILSASRSSAEPLPPSGRPCLNQINLRLRAEGVLPGFEIKGRRIRAGLGVLAGFPVDFDLRCADNGAFTISTSFRPAVRHLRAVRRCSQGASKGLAVC